MESAGFDRSERDRLGPCDASGPCQFEALPRQPGRSHADRWPALPGDRFQLSAGTMPEKAWPGGSLEQMERHHGGWEVG